LAATQEEVATLESRLVAARGESSSLQSEVERLLAERADLRVRLTEVEGRQEMLVGERSTLAERLDRTALDLTQAQSRASDLNVAYEGLLEEGEATQADLAQARLELEEAQSEVARLTGARGIYTVQPGDTLTTISNFFYRRAGRWPDILEANSFLIENPNLIYPGMVLIIPQ
jgi:nucleoid-associated protein YgaU